MNVTRRTMMAVAGAGLATGLLPRGALAQAVLPRMRVLIDNDFGADPDGLFQLAHSLLSPSIDVRGLIGSHVHATPDMLPNDGHQAEKSAAKAAELMELMKLPARPPVVHGSETALDLNRRGGRSAAVDMIVREALRTDTTLPLYYCAGAGLTDLAQAWLAEPRIGKRLRLVWIGGSEHPGTAPMPPGEGPGEYNLTIDRAAAQVVFGQSDIEIWQIPRNAYRQMLVSLAELREIARLGPVGAWLVAQVDHVRAMTTAFGINTGETYVLGDSPLVTMTALQASFQPDPASSDYITRPTPRIADDGSYVARADGRPMRVYTRIDMRLTFADMVAKLRG